MFDGKLYSVWINGVPSPCLSVYHDDGEAMNSFRSLILRIRDDQSKGVIDDSTDSSMALYVHGLFLEDGSVRGFAQPMFLMHGLDVLPESDFEVEVVE